MAKFMCKLIFFLSPASAAYMKTPLTGYEIDWSINSTNLTLMLKVASTGWIGFGISSSGAMPGSDVVRVSGDGVVEDGHVLDEQAPSADCKQDWTLEHRSVESGVTEVRLVRALNTFDTQDHVLVDDGVSNRIIIAYGDSKDFKYHGTKHAGMRLNFFRRGAASSQANGTTFLDFLAYNPANSGEAFPVPVEGNRGGVDTYVDLCMDIPSDVLSKPVHVTQISPIIMPGNEQIVHHFVIKLSPYPCSETSSDKNRVWVWAYGGAGTDALVLPPEAGFSLQGMRSVHNNVHYYNVGRKPNLLDRSGVRMYYTDKLRPHDAGMMSFGDQLLRMFHLSVKVGQEPLSKYRFQCSITDLPANQNVTVFAAFQHMHRDGFAFYTKVTDKEGALKKAVTTDFYRGDWQDTIILPETFSIKQGDQVTTDCVFNVKGGKGTLRFGLGSADEMCMEWLYYYPRRASLDEHCVYGVYGPRSGTGQFISKEGLKPSSLSRQFGTSACKDDTVSNAASVSSFCAILIMAAVLALSMTCALPL